jgi:hypothetical protein
MWRSLSHHMPTHSVGDAGRFGLLHNGLLEQTGYARRVPLPPKPHAPPLGGLSEVSRLDKRPQRPNLFLD